MPPVLLGISDDQKRALLDRYTEVQTEPGALSYGTVADYCDSADHLPWLSSIQGDLKDLQRPAACKALLAMLSPGSRILEIGAGEPHVAQLMAGLGYDVTVVDPYDGSGLGPTEFDRYRTEYPSVKIVRDLFSPGIETLTPASFDCIYSISVLEHVHQPGLANVFAGLRRFVRPGGLSYHLIDHVLEGSGWEFHTQHLAEVVTLQFSLSGLTPEKAVSACVMVLQRAREDVGTYYLSARGHNLWRGQTPYREFPFRKVISIQTCERLGN